jgi:hypothetical protein
MYHNTISWMIAGGDPIASDEDRRMWRQLADLRASRIDAEVHTRAGLRDIVARFRGGSATPPPAALDCCAA